jgi:hypothetical protein
MKEKIIETSKSFLGLSNLALPIMHGFAMGMTLRGTKQSCLAQNQNYGLGF